MAQIIGENSQGVVEFEGNELSIKSKYEDPSKLRLAAPEGVGSGAVSFNRLIDGVQRENVLFQGKQDERVRQDPTNPAGEFTLHLNNGTSYNDSAMVQVLEVRHDTIRILGVKFTAAQLAQLKTLIS